MFFLLLFCFALFCYCSALLASILGNVMKHFIVVGSDICLLFITVPVYVQRNCICKDDMTLF